MLLFRDRFLHIYRPVLPETALLQLASPMTEFGVSKSKDSHVLIVENRAGLTTSASMSPFLPFFVSHFLQNFGRMLHLSCV